MVNLLTKAVSDTFGFEVTEEDARKYLEDIQAVSPDPDSSRPFSDSDSSPKDVSMSTNSTSYQELESISPSSYQYHSSDSNMSGAIDYTQGSSPSSSGSPPLQGNQDRAIHIAPYGTNAGLINTSPTNGIYPAQYKMDNHVGSTVPGYADVSSDIISAGISDYTTHNQVYSQSAYVNGAMPPQPAHGAYPWPYGPWTDYGTQAYYAPQQYGYGVHGYQAPNPNIPSTTVTKTEVDNKQLTFTHMAPTQGLNPVRPMRRARHNRTNFTRHQQERLDEAFNEQRYPDVYKREAIAAELGLKEEVVRVWFKNHRAKAKRNAKGGQLNIGSSSSNSIGVPQPAPLHMYAAYP